MWNRALIAAGVCTLICFIPDYLRPASSGKQDCSCKQRPPLQEKAAYIEIRYSIFYHELSVLERININQEI